MKQKLLHFFAVFVALVMAIPIANATASDYNVATQTPGTVWNHTFTAPGSDAYQAAVLPNGYLYVIGTSTNNSGTIKTLYRINESGVVASSAGYETVHYGLAADDNGKIILVDQAWSTSGTLDNISIRTPNASTGHLNYVNGSHDITLTDGSIPSLTYYFDASGDMENGTGYMWFPPTSGKSNLKVAKIVRGSGTTWTTTFETYTLPFSAGANNAYMQVYESNENSKIWKFLFLNPFGSIYDCELNNGTITATPIDLPVRGANGLANAHIFFLGGHKILAYNTGINSSTSSNSNKANQFVIYDMDTKTTIATVNPFATTLSSSGTSIGSWLNSLKVSDTQTDLFVYCPGVGASRLSLTATPITSPVSNLSAALVDGSTTDVKVSWVAPSQGTATKYAVCYSTDGGTTWSTAVETNNLNYTFTGLTTGTYLFKVTPYFGGSSTWGQATATTEGIEAISGVGAPISNLSYTYIKNTDANVGRQDIVLKWTAPDADALVNTTLTGYKVYRGSTLLATLGVDATTYTHAGVTTNYTYTVVPLFSGLAEDNSLGQSVTPTEVVAKALVAPIFTEVRNYEGYSLVELFYQMPSYAPYKPLYYNLYRDGALIQGKLQSFNTLDESIVIDKVNNTTVKYQIEAVYGAAKDVYPPIDSVKSEVMSVVIARRDIAKNRYILQEVYNVSINEITEDKKPNLFDNIEYYRQGQFYDGHWYIAQRADNLSLKAQELAGGATSSSNYDDKSGIDGSTGGVVKFKATTKEDILAGLEGKPITTAEFSNVGIAIDNVGTIFVRSNNDDKLKATVPTGHGTESAWGWIEDSFMRRITEGTLYKRNADGSYTEQANKLDLTALWIDNRWIDDMTFTGVVGQGQVHGRSDYYSMSGDVLSADGGYLILSPSWTRTAFKVKIVNGAYVSHEVIEFNRYDHPSGNYSLTPSTGAENYGFKLAGRDDVTVQIRSNGYYGVHDWIKEGTSGWHPIFTAESRVNNAGGASVEAFGTKVTEEMVNAEGSPYTSDDIGKYNGELFIITPQSMHSHNVGDFLISRATKTNTTDLASEGTLMPSSPVAMKVQTDARSNSTATNANGNWFYAEAGTYAGPSSATDPCVDIYQYVPGTRFARYRLIPSEQFPPVQPTLTITTAYNEGLTEITHFDGVATWQRPAGFGRSSGSSNAKVVSYLFELLNSKNEVIASEELPEIYDEDGNPVSDDFVYNFDYKAKTGKEAKDVDIDFNRFTVSVQVKYQTYGDLTYHLSEKSYAEAEHDYVAKPAIEQTVDVYVKEDFESSQWVQNEKGEWVVKTEKLDVYRVDLDFKEPVDAEPVSYYTIRAVVNKVGENKGDTINITDFMLYNGIEEKDGQLWGTYENASQIPGTYDFGNAKAPYYTTVGADGNGLYGNANDGGSKKKLVLTWFHSVPVGTYDDKKEEGEEAIALASNDDVTITNDPSKWEFIITAHYAARNTYIDKEAKVGATPTALIPTGVEVVGDDNVSSLLIYPIPASTSITIKSPVAINDIVIYNEVGAEVMNANGVGENIVELNIESLATGYYFVKVNNNAPVKIIKK